MLFSSSLWKITKVVGLLHHTLPSLPPSSPLVGTGSGILAYFAVKAGARKVYAVEASDVADRAKILMQAAGLSDRVIVVKCKVEHLQLDEKVDVIISEPMGFALIHERSTWEQLRQLHVRAVSSVTRLHPYRRSARVVHDCAGTFLKARRPHDANDGNAARRPFFRRRCGTS